MAKNDISIILNTSEEVTSAEKWNIAHSDHCTQKPQ